MGWLSRSLHERPRTWLDVIVLSAICLAVRLLWLRVLSTPEAGEVWDAYGYYFRGTGFRQVFLDVLQGQAPSADAKLIAYNGLWPPLQSLLLSLGFLAFGPSVRVGQALMIVLAALTVPLVYLIARRMSGRPAAIIGSLVFILYPSLVHLSLRLLSETTSIFLACAAVHLALRTIDATTRRQVRWLAGATGFVLGLCTLTRAAALPWIPVLAVVTARGCRVPRNRLLAGTIVLVVAGVTLLPWELVLARREGRFVLVSTSSGENLYRGNNPWIPDGFGSYRSLTWPKMVQAAEDYTRAHHVSDQEAFQALAIEEIERRPALFLLRGIYKIRELWSADSDIAAWLLYGIYPPIGQRLAGGILLATVVSLPLVLAPAIWGLLIPAPALRHRGLVVGMLLGSMSLTFLTIGEEPRFHPPLVALVLPAIGHGAANVGAAARRALFGYATAASIAFALVATAIVCRIPAQYRVLQAGQPTSHYRDLVQHLDRWIGAGTTRLSDRVLLRVVDGPAVARVSVSIEGAGDDGTSVGPMTEWDPTKERGILNLVARTWAAREPAAVVVRGAADPSPHRLALEQASWHVWRPTGVPFVEYLWVGSASYPDKSNIGRTVARKFGDWDRQVIPESGDLDWLFKRFD